MKYYAPKALNEALNLLQELKGEKCTLLAGGTDVVPKMNCIPEKSGWMKNNGSITNDQNVIYLGNLNLNYISEVGNKIRVGSCTTLSDILRSSVIKKKVPVLYEAVSQIAGITIRNVATIGGNVMNASPAADSIPALMAIDAQLVLDSAEGERVLPMTDFFKGPGQTDIQPNEILKELIIPVYAGSAKFLKFGRRKAESLSVVNGAVWVLVDGGKCIDARLIVGSVAPTPLRLVKIEKLLIGQTLTDELIKKAALSASEMIAPIDDKRSTASYRRKLTAVMVERAFKEASQF